MRTILLSCLRSLALLAVAAPAFAQEEVDWSQIQLKITKVAGTVYMIDKVEGAGGFAGGNVGVCVGADGIVLVDDQFAPLAPKIVTALKTLSDKPVRFVINTHVHGDHTGGNVIFGTTATIIAHINTRLQLLADRPEPRYKPTPATALPIITVNDMLTLHQNGEDIQVFHLPNGHTDTDVAVYFKQSNVVHMGDEFFSGMFPFIGDGGSVKGLLANFEKVLSLIPADSKIIPGHGPLSTPVELRATLAMLRETSAIVEDGIKKKKSLEQLTKEKVLAKYEKWAGGYLNADQYLEQLYKVLSR